MTRLRLALAESDQLAVSTIHAFCKQVLGAESFLCGMPAGFEVLSDASELKSDAVKDTWRTDLAADALLAAVAAIRKWSVDKDLKAWGMLTRRPSTRMDPAPPSLTVARDRVAQALEAVKDARTGIDQLREIAHRDKVRLNNSKDKPGVESVANLDAWHTLLETMDPRQPPMEIMHVAGRLAAADSWFAKRGAVGKAASDEAAALAIVAAADAMQAGVVAMDWAWLAQLRQAAGQRFERSLRGNNAVTFDGLIQKLHQALCSGPNRAALARRLADQVGGRPDRREPGHRPATAGDLQSHLRRRGTTRAADPGRGPQAGDLQLSRWRPRRLPGGPAGGCRARERPGDHLPRGRWAGDGLQCSVRAHSRVRQSGPGVSGGHGRPPG